MGLGRGNGGLSSEHWSTPFLWLSMDIVHSASGESARVMGDVSPVPGINWGSARISVGQSLAAFELLLARHGFVLWQGLEPAWLSQATWHREPVSSSAPALTSSNSRCGFLLFIFPGLGCSIDKCDIQQSHTLWHGSSPCMPMQTQPIHLDHQEWMSPRWGEMSSCKAWGLAGKGDLEDSVTEFRAIKKAHPNGLLPQSRGVVPSLNAKWLLNFYVYFLCRLFKRVPEMVVLAVKHKCISFYSEIILIGNRMCWSLLPNMQKQMCFCCWSWLFPAGTMFVAIWYLQSTYAEFCWYSLGTMELPKHPEMVLHSVELC